MVRLILFLLAVVALASGLAWLADRPGNLLIHWQGYEVETSVFRAVVLLAALLGLVVLAWSILRQLWNSPAAIGHFVMRRRQKRGLEALSSGMIAIGAGDRSAATRYALQARRSLPNEPLTHLLRAQAAQLTGDRPTSRRVFEAMLGSPDTEQLGLRGLYLEAEREGEVEAARQFAERALRLNPKLAWPADSLFDLQCKQGDWGRARYAGNGASARPHRKGERGAAPRGAADGAGASRRGQRSGEGADALARGACARPRPRPGRSDRSPPAGLARQHAARHEGHTQDVVAVAAPGPLDRVRLRTPRRQPARPARPRQAARRAQSLRAREPHRRRQCRHRGTRFRCRACGAHAAARRSHHAPRVPAHGAHRRRAGRQGTRARVARPCRQCRARSRVDRRRRRLGPLGADLPVSGALDAFQWRVPVETLERSDGDLLARKIEELVSLGAPDEPVLAPAASRSQRWHRRLRPRPPPRPRTIPRRHGAPTRPGNGEDEAEAETPRLAAPRPARTDGSGEPALSSERPQQTVVAPDAVIVPPVRPGASAGGASPARHRARPGCPDGKYEVG